MALVKKRNMDERSVQAAAQSQTLEDRKTHRLDALAQMKELIGLHPAEDEPAAGSPQIYAPAHKPAAAYMATAPNGARFEIVPIDLIDVNPFNARQIYLPERVQKLAASLGAHGQEIPGVATPRGGRYVLAAGHYRLRALKVIAAKTMSLMVIDGLSDKDLYAHSYRENAEREEQTTLDNALSWKELLDKGVYQNETEIAEATGQSQSNVNRALSALRLGPKTLEVVREAPKEFGLTILNELAQYEAAAGEEKSADMARRVISGEATRKDIQAARAQCDKPVRKSKETSRQYKISTAGKHLGVIKDWDSGRVALDVVIEDPRERAAVVAELRERFGVLE